MSACIVARHLWVSPRVAGAALGFSGHAPAPCPGGSSARIAGRRLRLAGRVPCPVGTGGTRPQSHKLSAHMVGGAGGTDSMSAGPPPPPHLSRRWRGQVGLGKLMGFGLEVAPISAQLRRRPTRRRQRALEGRFPKCARLAPTKIGRRCSHVDYTWPSRRKQGPSRSAFSNIGPRLGYRNSCSATEGQPRTSPGCPGVILPGAWQAAFRRLSGSAGLFRPSSASLGPSPSQGTGSLRGPRDRRNACYGQVR